MGAWGLRSFDNDDAADWVLEFGEQGPGLIAETLNAALDDAEPDDENYPETPACCEALAAAEMVAAAKSGDHSHLSEPAAEALKKHDGAIATPENVVLAIEAAQRVKTRSELRLLWSETDELDDWVKDVDRLIAMLG
jgi:hypothetical protein